MVVVLGLFLLHGILLDVVNAKIGDLLELLPPAAKDIMDLAELAETDRKRYHIEKDAMQKKETKNDNHLKSKYLYFCKEERDKNPKIMLSNIAIMWAANKDDDKLNERYQTAKEKAIAAPVSIEA